MHGCYKPDSVSLAGVLESCRATIPTFIAALHVRFSLRFLTRGNANNNRRGLFKPVRRTRVRSHGSPPDSVAQAMKPARPLPAPARLEHRNSDRSAGPGGPCSTDSTVQQRDVCCTRSYLVRIPSREETQITTGARAAVRAGEAKRAVRSHGPPQILSRGMRQAGPRSPAPAGARRLSRTAASPSAEHRSRDRRRWSRDGLWCATKGRLLIAAIATMMLLAGTVDHIYWARNHDRYGAPSGGPAFKFP